MAVDIETFPNPAPQRNYVISHICPEFTSVCPKTGQPAFATIELEYVPDQVCLELKALKLYYFSFRDQGIFYEGVVNSLLDELSGACQPRWMRVTGRFNVRGGISSVIVAETGARPSSSAISDAYLGIQASYERADLDPEHLDPDPIVQLRRWIDEAMSEGVVEPNAMCLSTVAAACQPHSRIVLLRGLDKRGLTFYTNYESQKGRDLAENPRASVCFWWGLMERQARVEGLVEKVSAEESDAYFASRPRESQLASASSPQSQVVGSRQELESRMADLGLASPVGIARPENWGGYRLVPARFEFWQGRPARLHDRLVYVRTAEAWAIQRLAP